MPFKDKEAEKEYRKIYFQNNKQKFYESQKKYNLKNKNKVKVFCKKYYDNNKDKIFLKQKEYYENNKEIILKYHKDYYEINKEIISKKAKEYYEKNTNRKKRNVKKTEIEKKEDAIIYRIKNKEKLKNYQKIYREKNKEKLYKNLTIKRNTNPFFKLRCNISTSINLSLKNKGYKKDSKTFEILGCSYEEFKQHLERQFTKGMSWENKGQWHLDHIYPVSLAKDEAELIKLNHYTNFQPLWAKDNLEKHNKIIPNTQIKLI
jgi:hypothetical protein